MSIELFYISLELPCSTLDLQYPRRTHWLVAFSLILSFIFTSSVSTLPIYFKLFKTYNGFPFISMLPLPFLFLLIITIIFLFTILVHIPYTFISQLHTIICSCTSISSSPNTTISPEKSKAFFFLLTVFCFKHLWISSMTMMKCIGNNTLSCPSPVSTQSQFVWTIFSFSLLTHFSYKVHIICTFALPIFLFITAFHISCHGTLSYDFTVKTVLDRTVCYMVSINQS